MAEFLNKATLPVDVGKFTDKDMSCQTVMTEDFFQFNIPYAFELIPENSLKGVIKAFGRNTAMFKPVLGSAKCVYRKFFVPFRVVWPPYNSFRVNAPYTTDDGTVILDHVPLIPMSRIVEAFISGYTDANITIDPLMSEIPSSDPRVTSGAFDLEKDGHYYIFTRNGRLANKFMMSLGYRIVPINKDDEDFSVSALPFLCACKIYFDWFWPTQYAQVGAAAVFQGITHRHYVYTLTVKEFAWLLSSVLYTFYENDLFTSSWDNPVSPSVGAFSSLVIPDITNNAKNGNEETCQVVTNDSSSAASPFGSMFKPDNGTPFVGGRYGNSQIGYSSTVGVFTQYVDLSLHILSDIMHKNAIVGSRALERYLAQFGVKLSSEQLMRSVYLGQNVTPWQIGQVDSMADTVSGTSGAQLGDYAGKGLSFDEGFSIDYENPSEYGFFMVIHTLLPKISYVQGIDEHCFHKTMMDFFDGKLEQLGTTPIRRINLMSSKFGSNNWTRAVDAIFGFSRRYWEYVVPRDRLLGDFACDSVNTGLMAWSTARLFKDQTGLDLDEFVHSIEFMRAASDALQYDRVFYGSTLDPAHLDENVDNFKFVHSISVKFVSRTRPFYDSYDWMNNDNEKISIQGNGVRMS